MKTTEIKRGIKVILQDLMELQQLTGVTVEVSDGRIIEVVVIEKDGKVLAGNVHEKVCEDLELQSSSTRWFALYKGRQRPTMKYKAQDSIPSASNDLSLKKNCFNEKDERTLMRADMVACSLLYNEASSLVQKGCFKLTDEMKEKLKEYSSPGWNNEQKYLSICHSIPDYFSVRGDHCKLSHSNQRKKSTSTQRVMTVNISEHGITFYDDNSHILFPWCCITHWIIKDHHWLEYHFTDQSESQCTVSIETDQADYLLTGTVEFLKEAQKNDPDHPAFYADMISSSGGKVTYQNALYNKEKAKATSISFPD